MMSKKLILDEIIRTAQENNGVPLGIDRFRDKTGIRKEDWYGKYWTKWTDAQKEAGLVPNTFSTPRIDENTLLVKLIDYIEDKGRFPTRPDIKIKHYEDCSFPSDVTFRKRLGRKHEIAQKVIKYCKEKGNLQHIIEICLPHSESPKDNNILENGTQTYGHVYLLKHDNAYKIGKSYDITRRYKEIKVQMPHDTEEIHVIETDDPSGIEAYWHHRFKDKKLKGEWFNLSQSDVKAFKRRRFM